MKLSSTIFIVDDDEDDRLMMGDAIRGVVENINIVEVASGTELFQHLDENPSSDSSRLILIDMNMPRMNGLELLAILKGEPKCSTIPVIMLSTTSNLQLVNRAYELGINAFLVKPTMMAEFEWMAQMINFCFVTNFALGSLPSSKISPGWKNVLVIEDNDDHWELMNFSLKRSMPDVRLQRIAEKGTLLEDMKGYIDGPAGPEIILLDLYVPEREDGLHLLREIRRYLVEKSLPNIPVIVFSYSNSSQDVNAAISELANAYLVKPLDVSLWPVYLQNLCDVWSNAASLPRAV
ncbi:response regulator [Dyadobacter luticola]|uniref:Response regulator n=1 Tax=Dyadobacter luticola TaxID=1979387 RepID=A0A5R9L4A4_9BACT|nr:response regulator [Dyadobacter luticola]TLV03414.1 response regulator [Dyadobacter luticola]